MNWEEAEIWLAPVTAWVDAVAAAEEGDGTKHKIQAVYHRMKELASEVWLDNEMEEGAEQPDVDLELGASHGRNEEDDQEGGEVPGVSGSAPERTREDDSGGRGAPELSEEGTTADEAAADYPTFE